MKWVRIRVLKISVEADSSRRAYNAGLEQYIIGSVTVARVDSR